MYLPYSRTVPGESAFVIYDRMNRQRAVDTLLLTVELKIWSYISWDNSVCYEYLSFALDHFLHVA